MVPDCGGPGAPFGGSWFGDRRRGVDRLADRRAPRDPVGALGGAGDVVEASDTVVVAPGVTIAAVEVQVCAPPSYSTNGRERSPVPSRSVGDLDAEPDELVLVGFSNPTDIVVGTLVNDISFGLIVDDDG